MSKLVSDLRGAIERCRLRGDMCISFRHHFRGGDFILSTMIDEIADMGFKNLRINASPIHGSYAPLIKHMENGVVTALKADYIGPAVGKAVSQGTLKTPVILRTRGSKPSAIESGQSHIDITFLGTPTLDDGGNCIGTIDRLVCGSLGYTSTDTACAGKMIIITNYLISHPLTRRSTSEEYVDYVVKMDAIGDPAGTVSGTTRLPRDPIVLKIVDYAAKTIEASGLLENGFSLQTGAGGASLAMAGFPRDTMLKQRIEGSYCLGGITDYVVDMLEASCFGVVQDVQCFDLRAVESIRGNQNHVEMTANQYVSPTAKSVAASSLDVVVLGAAQIDTQLDVNVCTDSGGYIIGGSGGHIDITGCAKMAIVVVPLSRARMSIAVDKVDRISTPGSSADVLVTQYDICVNPCRRDLLECFTEAGVPVVDIHDQKAIAEKMNGIPRRIEHKTPRIVARAMGRNGTQMDTIHQVE